MSAGPLRSPDTVVRKPDIHARSGWPSTAVSKPRPGPRPPGYHCPPVTTIAPSDFVPPRVSSSEFAYAPRLPVTQVAGLDQARLVGVDHRLHPITDAELVEDAADMGLDRRLAERQLVADLGV